MSLYIMCVCVFVCLCVFTRTLGCQVCDSWSLCILSRLWLMTHHHDNIGGWDAFIHTKALLGPSLSLPPHLVRGPTTGPHTGPLCLLTSTFIYPPTCPSRTFSGSLTWFPPFFFLLSLLGFCLTPFCPCTWRHTHTHPHTHTHSSKVKLNLSGANKWTSFIFIRSEICTMCLCVCISTLHKYPERHMLYSPLSSVFTAHTHTHTHTYTHTHTHTP